MEEKNHIYPIFDRMMTRQDKEELLGQHSVMIWFTGLSGSGKSTIAIALERESLTGIIFVVVSIITSDFPKLTGWRISAA